jgi:hypothetical protein
MNKALFSMVSVLLTLSLTPLVQAQDTYHFISEKELGGSYTAINAAQNEAKETQNLTGVLVEIGNTTAENTTIVMRFKNTDGTTTDEAVEITAKTAIINRAGGKADLSDWIAGDQIQVQATHYRNSNSLEALNLRNISFDARHRGINGWVTALRPAMSQMEITYNNTTYTLNTSEAKMVGGIHNPGTLGDFKIGDRVRARVVEDGDGDVKTWKAEIIVTLRRGDDLIMRVTRWIVPATITAMPTNVNVLPATIEVMIQDSKFYQKNDVNNLVGVPGTVLKVDINAQTKLVRKYLGKANLNEFSLGDDIRIIGRLSEQSGHLIATVIKDNSVQSIDQRFRAATVTAINSGDKSLTVQLDENQLPYPGPMTPVARTWNVTTNNSTTYWRAGKQISFADLQTNTMIRVFGTVNIDNRQIAASTISVIIKPTGIELPQ